MRIVALSDTHGSHFDIKNIPNGDVLIHSGDFTARNSLEELPDFNDWMQRLPHKHKLFVPGNHDWIFDKDRTTAKEILSACTVLINEGITIDGIKFWGSPAQPIFCDWAFNIPDEKRHFYWEMVPEDTNILITHCPPNGILDNIQRYAFWDGHKMLVQDDCVGDRLLSKRIAEIKEANPNTLKLHFFGHIHDQTGIKEVKNTRFVNASLLDDHYDLTKEPIIIDLSITHD